MPHPAQAGLDLPKLGIQPLAHCVPPDQPPTLPDPPEDVGEAQEGEGFGLALTSGPAVLKSEPPELDDPGLVRVHVQRKRLAVVRSAPSRTKRSEKSVWCE